MSMPMSMPYGKLGKLGKHGKLDILAILVGAACIVEFIPNCIQGQEVRHGQA